MSCRLSVVAVVVVCVLFYAGCGSSTFVPAAASSSPLYVHLALTQEHSEIAVSWFSMGQSRGVPTVRFGTASGQLTTNATGNVTSYHPTAGYCYDTILKGLRQGVKYYYVCGSDVGGWSKEYYFTLKQVASKPTRVNPLVVPIFGDMGIVNSADTIKSLETLSNVNFYYHVGDISYANDRESSLYEKVWNEWFQKMEQIMPYTPYMVLPGNHEHSSGKAVLPYSVPFTVYRYRFKMPSNFENMWYSFDYENVHFVSISTETDYPGCQFSSHFGDQLKWLEADLAKATLPENKAKRPWIIVSGHRPLYSSSSDDYMVKYLAPMQRAFEELFHKYKVDLYFCGHVHAYERSYPVYKNQVPTKSYHNPPAIVTVTTGAAGDIEGLSRDLRPLDWSAVRYEKATGYGVLFVYGDNELKWNFYRSSDRKLLDTFTLTKGANKFRKD